ncbi:VOC family protein [Alkalicoccus luteus]|uniref:VOC family protein n=1 Tax=Alkalicoccus luteus TaxID=1237094 RepID=A0A969PT15_9BACI|nr:VOC family protein [Alkalicoccus luteus]NJP38564.1 VOC family protein [Alkalicoccus luteus]
MKTGIEIDLIVHDSLDALRLYETIFDIKRLTVTDLQQGQNEVIFSIYGTEIHLLDENEAYGMKAPSGEEPLPIWINVTVPDIHKAYNNAIAGGCRDMQPVTTMEKYGISNAVFMDPFGYQWMLHEVHRELSEEERDAMLRGE